MEPTSALQIASRTPPQRKVAGSESWLRKMDRGMLREHQPVCRAMVSNIDGRIRKSISMGNSEMSWSFRILKISLASSCSA